MSFININFLYFSENTGAVDLQGVNRNSATVDNTGDDVKNNCGEEDEEEGRAEDKKVKAVKGGCDAVLMKALRSGGASR